MRQLHFGTWLSFEKEMKLDQLLDLYPQKESRLSGVGSRL